MQAPAGPVPDPELISLRPDGGIPNNPTLPVVLLRAALSPDAGADEICKRYEANGWGGTWVWSVFDFDHFHPNAHEVLVVARGWAVIRLGGPAGKDVRLVAGDMLVLPAGTGHCRVSAGPGFAVCGGYPPGQFDYETLRAGEATARDIARIADVPVPHTDPVFGRYGPLIAAWTK